MFWKNILAQIHAIAVSVVVAVVNQRFFHFKRPLVLAGCVLAFTIGLTGVLIYVTYNTTCRSDCRSVPVADLEQTESSSTSCPSAQVPDWLLSNVVKTSTANFSKAGFLLSETTTAAYWAQASSVLSVMLANPGSAQMTVSVVLPQDNHILQGGDQQWLYQPNRTTASAICRNFYTSVSGDSCSDIAQRYGWTLQQLQAANPSVNCGYGLQPGVQFCIPDRQPCTKDYSVKAGDTCWAISQNNSIPLSVLLSINPDVDCSNLQIGQDLCIAGRTLSPCNDAGLTLSAMSAPVLLSPMLPGVRKSGAAHMTQRYSWDAGCSDILDFILNQVTERQQTQENSGVAAQIDEQIYSWAYEFFEPAARLGMRFPTFCQDITGPKIEGSSICLETGSGLFELVRDHLILAQWSGSGKAGNETDNAELKALDQDFKARMDYVIQLRGGGESEQRTQAMFALMLSGLHMAARALETASNERLRNELSASLSLQTLQCCTWHCSLVSVVGSALGWVGLIEVCVTFLVLLAYWPLAHDDPALTWNSLVGTALQEDYIEEADYENDPNTPDGADDAEKGKESGPAGDGKGRKTFSRRKFRRSFWSRARQSSKSKGSTIQMESGEAAANLRQDTVDSAAYRNEDKLAIPASSFQDIASLKDVESGSGKL